MSIRALHEVFEHSRAEHGARLVLIAIADNASDDGVGWPGPAELMSKTLLSEKAVRDGVRAAERLGELQTRKARRGRSFINVYRVTVGRIRLVEVDYSRLPFELLEPFVHPADSTGSTVAFTRQISPGDSESHPADLPDSPGKNERVHPAESASPTRARDSLFEPPGEPSCEPSAAAAAAELEDLARRLNSETVAASLLHELEQMRAPTRIRKAALAEPDRVLAWIETARAEARTNFGAFVVMGLDSGEWPVRRDPGRQTSTRAGWAREVAPLLDAEHVDLILREWFEAGRIDQAEADELREIANGSREQRSAAEAAA